MPLAGTQAADTVTHVHTVCSTSSFNRPMMHCESDTVSLAQRHDFRAGLHPRSLLGEHKLSASEVPTRPRQQDRYLDGEHMLSVEILMEAVVIAFVIFEQQRCGFVLPCPMATREKLDVLH